VAVTGEQTNRPAERERLPLAAAQAIAVPAYFRPGADWDRMSQAHPALGLAVLNSCSGPGAAPEREYVDAVARCQRAGVRVIGYVHTAFADSVARPPERAIAEIDAYYAWYGVDGIFFDETSSDAAHVPYYAELTAFARQRPGALTVLNPGCVPAEQYMQVADIIVTFENTYAAYTHAFPRLPGWMGRYAPRRFWHLVYAAPDAQAMEHAVALSRRRRAGWLYVTPCAPGVSVDGGHSDHPWCRLPSEPYWSAELTAVAPPVTARASIRG